MNYIPKISSKNHSQSYMLFSQQDFANTPQLIGLPARYK